MGERTSFGGTVENELKSLDWKTCEKGELKVGIQMINLIDFKILEMFCCIYLLFLKI